MDLLASPAISRTGGSLLASTLTGMNDTGVTVMMRVRPPNQRELDNGGSQQCLQADVKNNTVTLLSTRPETMTFDHVLDTNATQEEIFRAVGKNVTENCLQGYNATVFAYGQTGAGKTFTMHGPSSVNEDGTPNEQRGLVPRIFEYLFARIAREQKKTGDRVQYLCSCSNIEIYQDQVYDLLEPMPTVRQLRENMKNGVYVDGAIEETITTPEEAYTVLQRGTENRRVAETAMNHESSRSHSVFILYIRSKTKEGSQTVVRESRFNLVDLAGSERQKDTHTENMSLREAGKINKSLHVLGTVINALAEQSKTNTQRRHIPYRDSKLTFLLRDSLGGNSKTYIIANVSPSVLCMAETGSTLRFARSAKLIRNLATVNADTTADVGPLLEENANLKRQLQAFMQGNLVPSSPAKIADDSLVISLVERERGAIEKYKRLEDQIKLLQKQQKETQDLIQGKLMIIKLREGAITSLKKQNFDRETFLAMERENKEIELKERQRSMDINPEVTKFAAENLQLREQITELQKQLELYKQPAEHLSTALEHEERLKDIIGKQAKDIVKAKDAALSDRTNELQQDLDRANQQLQALRQQFTSEQNTSLQTIQKQSNDLSQLNYEKLESLAEIDSLRKQCKDLETALESRRHAQELEIKRLTLTIDSLRDDHVKASSDVSSVSSQLADLQTELTTWKQRADQKDREISTLTTTVDTLEQKCARMSNFAAESKAATQETMRMLSERASSFAAEKDKAEDRVAELAQKLSEKNREIDHLRLDHVKSEDTIAELNREKSELDEENAKCENELRKKTEESAKLSMQVQSLQSDILGLHDELAFHTQQGVRDEKEIAHLKSLSSQQDQDLQQQKQKMEQLAAQVHMLMQQGDTKYAEAVEVANELRSELAMIQDQRDSLESTVAMLQSANGTLQTLRTQLERDAMSNQQSIKELMGKLKEDHCRVLELEEERAELVSVIEQLRAASDQLAQKETQLLSAQTLLAQANEQLSIERKAHASDLEQALADQNTAEIELSKVRKQLDDVEQEREEQHRIEMQATQQQNELMMTLRRSIDKDKQNLQSTVALLEKELEAQLIRSSKLEEQQAQMRKEQNDESKAYRAQQALCKNLERQLESLKIAMVEARTVAADEARIEMSAQLEQADTRIQQLEQRVGAILAERDAMSTELKQTVFRLQTAEQDILSVTEEYESASKLEEQANHRAEEAETKLRQLQESLSSIFTERDRLRAENERLTQGRNDRQRIQHLLEVKRENNLLRDSMQDLQKTVQRLERELRGGDKRGTVLAAAGTENRLQS